MKTAGVITLEEDIRVNVVREVAHKMLTSARTAPKARGIDNLVLAIIEDKNLIERVASHMKRLAEEMNMPAFNRDSVSISALSIPMLLLFGTKIRPVGLSKCGMCGHTNCQEKAKLPLVPCVFNTGDLGLAIGSAVSVAADNRVDNRVMYTVGVAAVELALLGPEVKIAYGVPISIGAKNPFFDRLH